MSVRLGQRVKDRTTAQVLQGLAKQLGQQGRVTRPVVVSLYGIGGSFPVNQRRELFTPLVDGWVLERCWVLPAVNVAASTTSYMVLTVYEGTSGNKDSVCSVSTAAAPLVAGEPYKMTAVDVDRRLTKGRQVWIEQTTSGTGPPSADVHSMQLDLRYEG